MTARFRGRSSAATCLAAIACALLAVPALAHAARAGSIAPPPVPTVQMTRIALIADTPQWPAAETDTTALFDMMNAQQVAMIVHAGGIKGDTESCGDTVLNARLQVLDDSPTPLLYVPGETDWAECQKPSNGKFDAVERLNRLRELFFPLDTTLGRRTLPVVRQSDQALFRSYRENVRLVTGGVMLVGLNLPGDNNHYRIEGGRNGEFEDRREANRQWLARAFSVAEQRDLPGIVVIAHADPLFGNGWEKRGKPSLLDAFVRHGARDGYLEFKRQLRDLSSKFSGQVLLVHASDSGFSVDKPLRDTSGKIVANFTRVALPIGTPSRWTELTITPGTRSVFQVQLQDGPKGN
ncbi:MULTISPECIES: hypothetical protein [Cupriavidus]|jgi:hypothetical protein|uniref:Uncharacterized protein n=1 Tax=Cupriavidus metallidurans TaxID=119219 RepID=A0A132HIX7_9BURK|nr:MULTISPECIES: hypothetical protein [Cupriavidus]KWR82752.1 hypothetical protein RN01_11470 [Cupriavidus sp. SHE]KWW36768.1 hypothetical protein AU374_02828 [Cupriavidus metallidurans]QBP09251.1 hypothetical protein DDF84_005465 [Cupriavidus metallidurans]QWC89664.1 hypothetical protein KB891_05515 [Cupriavidus metallidurans]